MSHIFTVPHLNKQVLWNNGDRTYIVGANGVGKTLLLESMMTWCEEMGYNYNHYDAMTAMSEAPFLIQKTSDDDIIYACKVMCDLLIDFKDDIAGWAKAGNNHSYDQIGDYMSDHILLRNVLSMCGTGHTRFFVLTMKAIMNPTAEYYFLDLPETSLHIMVAQKVVAYLMKKFPYMKIIITTHSPSVISRVYNDDGSLNMTDIIELPSGYIKDTDDHSFSERFA